MPRAARRRAVAAKAALALMAAALVVHGVGGLHRSGVAAEEFRLTGVLSAEPTGSITIRDGSGTYGVVSGMYLRPYLGRTVTLEGGIEDGDLYVEQLTLGALDLDASGGRILLTATGTVQEDKEGFQATVEGITFTLVGSEELDQVVGKTAQIEGELFGTTVVLTSLRTEDGEIEIDQADTGVEPPGGGQESEPTDDFWGGQTG